MSTTRKCVHVNAHPEVLLAFLLNEVTSAKKLLIAALVTYPYTCDSFTLTYIYK